jgi:5'-nucleotidase
MYLNRKLASLSLALIFILSACVSTTKKPVEFIFLQINDVYEISPISGGKYGGMARIASLKKQLIAENPNTFLFLSGDFLNPSAIGAVKVEGKSIKGKHMTEVLNAAKVDFVTFGNHEFDLSEEQLLECIELSEFEWIATNTFHVKDGKPAPFVRKRDNFTFPTSKILSLKNENGDSLRVGILGLTIDYTKPKHVFYAPPFEAAAGELKKVKPQSDVIFAMTHFLMEDDKKMAITLPEIRLLMGGHDHDNILEKVGQNVVAKADANARTAYIHRIKVFPDGKVDIKSELKIIDESLNFDPETQAVVEKWLSIAKEANKNLDFEKVVYDLGENVLNAKESEIRNKQCEAGQWLLSAMDEATGLKADVVLLGSGTVRIDDELKGKITQYDVLRILPFGGGVDMTEISGEMLIKLLEGGEKNIGTGGYLQRLYVEKDSTTNEWKVRGKKIEASKKYKVVVNEYVTSGKENNMDFMSAENPKVKMLINSRKLSANDLLFDIRKVFIRYLENRAAKN